MSPPRHSAILLAAGSGRRMGGAVADKILAPLAGKPVFVHSLEAFRSSGLIRHVVIAYRDATQHEQLKSSISGPVYEDMKITWVEGGARRQDSVTSALEALSDGDGLTFIHDAARPALSSEILSRLAKDALRDGAACLAHPLVDTVKRIPQPEGLRQIRLEDLQRERLWAVETPQVFQQETILRAYRLVRQQALEVTDDTAAAALIDIPVTLVPNDRPNPKITSAADLAYVRWLFSQ